MIKNAQVEDEGDYICQASVTSTGEVQRFLINVQVMCKCKFILEENYILTLKINNNFY